ncbi:lantibiotic dehydratase C-terminal domain-containing protein [Arthrobacter sp. YD2]|uniref:lantibiotic dehydratase C-terminal domain-containing protein n=1 Tax=Arthrobacter sp. YD2 TaxID=3058046 RepID=UPI0025B44DFF|nr:lantibiotic dehydratase C-terminal domain-containing protein [Arthrobacter sp. YD2]MDN3903303.1 lantibiotic dehydratase C-terminal domain-containing protein [Arthrobacter sp. YD2]
MSQTTQAHAVRRELPGRSAGQLSESTLWSILTIESAAPEPEHRDWGDAVIRRVAVPLSAQARTWGGYRFGFTRNPAPDHPAVHLHLRAAEVVVGRAWKFARTLADGNAAALGPVKLSTPIDIVYPPLPGEPVPELMEATFARFGGEHGLKLVAEVSELSADLAMWAVNRFPGPSMRSTLGALLLFDAAHAMMRGRRSAVWPDRRATSWDYYWNAHLQACIGASGQPAEHVRRAMVARMAPRIMPMHRVMAALASEPAVDLWRKRWGQAIDLYLYRADKQRVSRSAQRLTMAASGLMLNRLGISLREEATLGLYARAWSTEAEAHYSGEG